MACRTILNSHWTTGCHWSRSLANQRRASVFPIIIGCDTLSSSEGCMLQCVLCSVLISNTSLLRIWVHYNYKERFMNDLHMRNIALYSSLRRCADPGPATNQLKFCVLKMWDDSQFCKLLVKFHFMNSLPYISWCMHLKCYQNEYMVIYYMIKW